jgi:RHS repeat-associated protein
MTVPRRVCDHDAGAGGPGLATPVLPRYQSDPGLDFQTWETTNLNRLQSYTYDAAGNMTYDGFNTYTYYAEGNITAVDGGSTATYVYNALNQRVRTTVNSGTPTEFVFNANGQRVSEWNASTRAQLKGKYYWGATPVAYYTTAASGSAGAHFEHQDWLGTERMRTKYNGAPEGTYTSLPWGDDQAVASGSDLDANHYATLDYDAETNTDHAQFRQYGDTAGNWKSPDPYYGSYDLSNPQSMNRYVYAMNNPLSNIDPSGLSTPVPCDEDGTACPPPYLPPDPCDMDSSLPMCADPPCSGSDFYAFYCDPDPPGPQKPSCGNGANCNPAPNNVSKHYGITIPCTSSAADVMNFVQTSFGTFGNYSRWAGEESVTFSPPSGMGVGSTIPISVGTFGIFQTLSVNVASMNSQSMTFTTNPGHLLYPASITFSASPAAQGSINFNINLGGTIANRFEFYLGGGNFEDAQWNHFLGQVGSYCKQQ